MDANKDNNFGLIRDFRRFTADKPQIYSWLVGTNQADEVRVSSKYKMYAFQYSMRDHGFGPAELAQSMLYLAHYFHYLTDLQRQRAELSPGSSLSPIGDADTPFETIYDQMKDFSSRIDMIKRWESTLLDDDSEELRIRIEFQKQELGHDSAVLRESLNMAVRDLQLFHEMRAEKNDDPSNALAEYLAMGYRDMSNFVAQATEAVMPQRVKNLPVKQISTTDAKLDKEIPRASAVELAKRLKTEQPALYDWMVEQGWTAPKERPSSAPEMNTEIWRVRNEIEGIVNEMVGLDTLGSDLLKQPAISAEEGRKTHDAQLTPEGRRAAMRMVSDDVEETKTKPYVDVHESQRPYDIFTHGGKDTICDKLKNMTNTIHDIGVKCHPLTHPEKRVTSFKGGEAQAPETIDELIKAITYRSGGVMRDSQTIARELNGYVEGQSGGETTSQLLPMSLAGAQFCRDEIYPRIRQDAWQLEKLADKLSELYREQETGKKAVVPGEGTVVTSFLDRRKQQMATKIGDDDADKGVT